MDKLKIVESAQTVRTTDVVYIIDEKNNHRWFIAVERMNGKFEKIREMMNEEFFRKKGADYMQKVYELAYNSLDKTPKK